jgi:hypothetical protein
VDRKLRGYAGLHASSPVDVVVVMLLWAVQCLDLIYLDFSLLGLASANVDVK